MHTIREWWKWFAMETGHPVMAAIVLFVMLVAGPCVLVMGMAKAFDSGTFAAAVDRNPGKAGELDQRQELMNRVSTSTIDASGSDE